MLNDGMDCDVTAKERHEPCYMQDLIEILQYGSINVVSVKSLLK